MANNIWGKHISRLSQGHTLATFSISVESKIKKKFSNSRASYISYIYNVCKWNDSAASNLLVIKKRDDKKATAKKSWNSQINEKKKHRTQSYFCLAIAIFLFFFVSFPATTITVKTLVKLCVQCDISKCDLPSIGTNILTGHIGHVCACVNWLLNATFSVLVKTKWGTVAVIRYWTAHVLAGPSYRGEVPIEFSPPSLLCWLCLIFPVCLEKRAQSM